MSAPDRTLSVAERRGRAVGIGLYALFVAGITVLWSAQILSTAWAPAPASTELECRAGLRSLLDTVRRARAAAAGEIAGERESLARFRAEVEPTWQRRPEVGTACRADPEASRFLRELDMLRYAEEHAVRYEAVDVARRRRKMLDLEARVLDHSPSAATSAASTTGAAASTH
jgi:hypothetical protein